MSDPIIPPSHVHRIRYLKFNSLVWQTGFLWVTKIKKKSKSRHLLMIVLHRSYRISQTVLEDRPTPLSCQVVRPFLGVSHITAAMLRTITMNNLCLVGDRDITFRLDSSPVPVWTLGGISRVTLKNCFTLQCASTDDCLENYLTPSPIFLFTIASPFYGRMENFGRVIDWWGGYQRWMLFFFLSFYFVQLKL